MKAGFAANVDHYAAMPEARRAQAEAAMKQARDNANHHLSAIAKARKIINRKSKQGAS